MMAATVRDPPIMSLERGGGSRRKGGKLKVRDVQVEHAPPLQQTDFWQQQTQAQFDALLLANATAPALELEPLEGAHGEALGFGPGYAETDLMRMYDEAVAADKGGDLKRSEVLLTKLAIVNPKDGRVWSRLARLQRSRGNAEGARAVLHRALQAIPSNAHIWHSLAELERDGGHIDGARSLYMRATELNPLLSHAWDAWGRMEARTGDVRTAHDLFAKGLQGDPHSHRLWHAYGVACDRLGDAEEAAVAFDKGLRLAPTNQFLLIAKAIMLWRGGDAAAARGVLNRCLSFNPRSTEAWLTLAQLEEADGRIPVARALYRRATGAAVGGRGVAPQLPQAKARTEELAGTTVGSGLWQAWARMEELAGNTAGAVAVYSQSTLLFERAVDLWVNWAKLEADNSNELKAREILQHAARIDPSKPGPHQSSAELEMDMGQFERARVLLFKGALASAGTDGLGPLVTTWAICEWRLKKPDRARKLFEWAVRVWSDAGSVGAVWQAWAAMEAQQGNVDLAANYVSRAVLADSGDWHAWALWARLERRRGAHDRAAEYLTTAKALKAAEAAEETSSDVNHNGAAALEHGAVSNNAVGWSGSRARGRGAGAVGDDLGHPLKRERGRGAGAVGDDLGHSLKRVFHKRPAVPMAERFRL
ncbi:hypothetical protein JKP88DRAFT_327465 [Tribonema minus]|uniref:PsbB mRNA maturation factor Mbb1 n=1 Tax=Tribonema minus TaxID=303371 RepID=A0A835YPV9_9STRA|nr:hypothetical protein JKP88DRAFT_327465 [Tribonema minus]